MKRLLSISILLSIYQLTLGQGPYAPPAEQSGTTAIFKDSSVFVGWAISANIERGWQNIADTTLGKTSAGDATSPTDKAGVNGVISLGDGGAAILSFAGSIFDGTGPDFAVFENSFDGSFLELAFVEVSSDGINFYRFDAVSLTDNSAQVGSFGNLDATNLYNLAGKYKAQYGTPFDLNELAGTTGLDINNITHIKITDVVGNISMPFATFDSQNNAINDPWPTAFATGGFDLDAIGVIHMNATGINKLNSLSSTKMYPNPLKNNLNIVLNESDKYNYQLIDLSGKTMLQGSFNAIQHQISLSDLSNGIYFLKLNSSKDSITKKIVKQ